MTDVGLKRDPFVGGEARDPGVPIGTSIPRPAPSTPEVGTYVIKTADLRYVGSAWNWNCDG